MALLLSLSYSQLCTVLEFPMTLILDNCFVVTSAETENIVAKIAVYCA